MIPNGTHKGFKTFFRAYSYCCPALHLYGFVNDLALNRAINREMKKLSDIKTDVNGNVVSFKRR